MVVAPEKGDVASVGPVTDVAILFIIGAGEEASIVSPR